MTTATLIVGQTVRVTIRHPYTGQPLATNVTGTYQRAHQAPNDVYPHFLVLFPATALSGVLVGAPNPMWCDARDVQSSSR